MALFLTRSHSLFLHIPKTGGSWVRRALGAAQIPGVTIQPYGSVTGTHPLACDCPHPYQHSFCFVRHPLKWYESIWKYQQGKWINHEPSHWHPGQCFIQQCKSDDFAQFVSLVCDHQPAFVTRMYEWYAGPYGRDDVMVGRCEHLAEDLAGILSACGESFEAEAFAQIPPYNVSPNVKCRWTNKLIERVSDLEWPTIERFYADDEFHI